MEAAKLPSRETFAKKGHLTLINQIPEGIHVNGPQLSSKLIEITSHFGVGPKQVNDKCQQETSDYNEDKWDRHSPPSPATLRPNAPDISCLKPFL
jgi:hypothetical protein